MGTQTSVTVIVTVIAVPLSPCYQQLPDLAVWNECC